MQKALQFLGVLWIGLLQALLAESAHAQLPSGLRYDDGFAHFYVTDRGTTEGTQQVSRYNLFASARILGTGIAPNSAFEFVVRQGTREVGRFTCNGSPGWRTARLPETPADSLFVADCANRDSFYTVDGVLTVEVAFIDDRTDARTLVRTHTVDVRRLSRARGNGQPDRDDFVVNAHAEIGAVLLETVSAGRRSMYAALSGSGGGDTISLNTVMLYVPRSSPTSPGSLQLRCSVNGERIELPFATLFANEGTNIDQRRYVGTEGRYVNRQVVGEYLHFRTDGFVLPLTFGTPETGASDRVNLSAHTGSWECELRAADRSVFRTIRFVVTAEGVAPHAEEGAGLSLPEGVHLVDAVVPSEGALDERTDPAAARAGAFYGRAWATDVGRTAHASIPARGEAYPPSARRSASTIRR